jgi:hypothetical protein
MNANTIFSIRFAMRRLPEPLATLTAIGVLIACQPTSQQQSPGDEESARPVYQSAAPEPAKAGKGATLEGAFALLGQPFMGTVVGTFIGDGTRCRAQEGNINCPPDGVRFGIDGSDIVSFVAVYPNVVGDRNRAYTGPLPFGLSAVDSRATVLSRLGAPDARGETWDHFSVGDLRVFVNYFGAVSPKAGHIREVQVKPGGS